MMKEGYFKFNAVCAGVITIDPLVLEGMNAWRQRLRALGMIGAFETGELAGVGFGNISQRSSQGFLITATGTGHLPVLHPRDYCEVVAVDLEKNAVSFRACAEGISPSSECMTHGVLYVVDSQIGAVIHVHHSYLWQCLVDRYPTTARHVEYGSPEMGRELMRLYHESELPGIRVVVMGGHEDGLIAFGPDIDEAGRTLLDAYQARLSVRVPPLE